MKNEQKKFDNHNRICIIIAAILLCAVVYCTVRSCGSDAGTAELYQHTDATVDAVEKEHAAAGRELDVATGQLNSAGTAVGRAEQFITASQKRVTENTAGLAECQQIVSECRKIVADSQRIYSEVEKANRAGTGSGG